jgi:DNA-binding MltR family transcriptional regulator
MSEKIEDLHPHYKTVLQELRYGLEVLENKEFSDKEKISRAKHQIKDAIHLLGYTEELVKTYKRTPEPEP